MRRLLLVFVAALALSLMTLPAARAEVSCDPLSTGAIAPPTSLSTIEVVAPVGWLIDEVCLVTEGSLVPSHLVVDPLVPSLVLDGEGAGITQYSASFVIAPQSSGEEADVFVPPQSATVPLAEQSIPSAANAGEGPAAQQKLAFASNALLGIGLMAFAAAAAELLVAHRRRVHREHAAR